MALSHVSHGKKSGPGISPIYVTLGHGENTGLYGKGSDGHKTRSLKPEQEPGISPSYVTLGFDDINFQNWMSDWTRLYRSNTYKFEACHVAVTTNEMARRFLDDPARLIDTYYQAAKGIEESNEIQARQLIEWYLPKKAKEEDLMQADAARMADMVLSRAMLPPGRESREDGHGDDSTPSPSP